MNNKKNLIKKIKHKKAVVGIIGLGYVGLPLALECCKKGFKTIGFDIDEKRIRSLKKNQDSTNELSARDIKNSSNLKFTSNEKDLSNKRLFVFGNLPYNISTRVLTKWILNDDSNFWYISVCNSFKWYE